MRSLTFDPQEYWETRLSKSYDLNGVGFLGLQSYNKWLYRVKEKAFFNNVLAREDWEVFDIGSGTGFYIDLWNRVGVKSVSGSDMTSVAVNNLRAKYAGSTFYQCDISDSAQLPKQQFDVLSAFDVLFHIVDDTKYEQAIRNIYSLLKPGGIFIFTENFLHQETVRIGWVASRSLAEITNILKKTGFEILKRKPQFVYMNNPIDSKNRLRQKLWWAMMMPAYKSNLYGNLLGTLLYPFECYAITHLNESPTTEIMICRKR